METGRNGTSAMGTPLVRYQIPGPNSVPLGENGNPNPTVFGGLPTYKVSRHRFWGGEVYQLGLKERKLRWERDVEMVWSDFHFDSNTAT